MVVKMLLTDVILTAGMNGTNHRLWHSDQQSCTYNDIANPFKLQTGIIQNVIVLLYFFNQYIYIYCRLKETKLQTFNNSTLDFCWPDRHYFKTAASIHATSNHSNSVSPKISWQNNILPSLAKLYCMFVFIFLTVSI